MAGVILAVVERPQTADRTLAGAGTLAEFTGAARINVLAIRTPPLETIVLGEEILSREGELRIRADEQVCAAARSGGGAELDRGGGQYHEHRRGARLPRRFHPGRTPRGEDGDGRPAAGSALLRARSGRTCSWASGKRPRTQASQDFSSSTASARSCARSPSGLDRLARRCWPRRMRSGHPRHVLGVIADHRVSRVAELLPWNIDPALMAKPS